MNNNLFMRHCFLYRFEYKKYIYSVLKKKRVLETERSICSKALLIPLSIIS